MQAIEHELECKECYPIIKRATILSLRQRWLKGAPFLRPFVSAEERKSLFCSSREASKGSGLFEGRCSDFQGSNPQSEREEEVSLLQTELPTNIEESATEVAKNFSA